MATKPLYVSFASFKHLKIIFTK